MPNRPDAIRVVLAEDSYLVREGVTRRQARRLLTDIRMPPTGTDEGIRAAEHLRETSPSTGVVLLRQYADPVYALSFLEKGSER